MSSGRLELKVGLFVIVLLGLAAVMSIKFSKTGFGLGDTYSIKLKTKDAGTVIKDSPVLMSGVKVGYVDEINLDLHGSVTLTVKLFSKYADSIDANATFKIKSSGFLGDQYIGVFPPSKRTKPLRDGAQKPCESPFDIMSVGRDAQELILSVSDRVKDLNATIVKINEGLLSEKTLKDFTDSMGTISRKIKELEDLNATKLSKDVTEGVADFRSTMKTFKDISSDLSDFNATEVTKNVTEGIADLRSTIKTFKDLSESQNVTNVVENILESSRQLRDFTADLNSTFANNRTNITKVIGDISVVTERLKSITENADKIAKQLESGKGLAGGLLKNEEMRVQFQSMISNLNTTAKGLTNIVNTINARGLFFKPPPEKIVLPPRTTRPK